MMMELGILILRAKLTDGNFKHVQMQFYYVTIPSLIKNSSFKAKNSV